jgi:RNA polymerase sigma-70 factor, ECF subfamily
MSMDESQHWQTWVQRLEQGDTQVVRAFWESYGPRLQGLAARYLHQRMRRREEPEDVVQSVCRTFFRRAREGEFEIADRDGLWRLLCAITVAKSRQKARFHRAMRRSLDREREFPADVNGSSEGAPSPPAQEPSPAEQAEFCEQLERLLSSLDDEERRLLELRLAEHTHEEAAAKMGCSERTVRRIQKRLQHRLAQMLEEPHEDADE